MALVETATASGLWRLSPAELDPWRASTFSTGELIGAALPVLQMHEILETPASASGAGPGRDLVGHQATLWSSSRRSHGSARGSLKGSTRAEA